ncbi:MAG: alpha/beta hydrolase [Planctomycetes bacterium]|nr:alpha/beta hydrolase [Planctomycetota bacterium]
MTPISNALVRRSWRVLRVFLCAYLGVILVLSFLENRLVFRPSNAQEWAAPPSSEIQDVHLTSADGTKIHAWWCPCDEPGAILYCHGNAGNLSHRGRSILKMRDLLNAGVLIFDYPGYGKSDGNPTEEGCYLAAEAAYDWLVGEMKIDPNQILLYGGSLGGGVAVHIASRRPHRALVLAKTFTSAPDVAGRAYPWLPVHWVMRNRFDNLARIKECRQPVFIGHGTADRLIPFAQGRRLFEAANEPKRFCTLNGSGHDDPLPKEFFQELKEFLGQNALSTQ